MSENLGNLECGAMQRLDGYPMCFAEKYHLPKHKISSKLGGAACMECYATIIGKQDERIEFLDELASTDHDTKIANRRGLEAKFDELVENGVEFAFIQADLINLKAANKVSTSAGDRLIRAAARALSARTEEGDDLKGFIDPDRTEENFPSRTGGDEFGVLLNLESREDRDDAILTPDQKVRLAALRYIENMRKDKDVIVLKEILEGQPCGMRLSFTIYQAGDTLDDLIDRSTPDKDNPVLST